MNSNEGYFLVGFLAGFGVAGFAGYMLNRINKARNDMRAPDRPMNVPTGKTPRSVMVSAAESARTCMLWSLALVLFLAVVALALFSLFGF
jgi:hypothetical protein